MPGPLTPIRAQLAGLPRRVRLTVEYHGGRETARRVATFPLRFLPGRGPHGGRGVDATAPARRWFRGAGRPVAIVIPTYGDTKVLLAALRSIRRTTRRLPTRVIVADDGSAPEHVAALRRLERRFDLELVLGDAQRGFAANCNRGLRRARTNEDVVLLNSDVIARRGWLQSLQHAAHTQSAGIVGGRLLYPDRTIQFGGIMRNPDAPQWFDHRFRFRPADFPPAEELQTTLAVTGACLYVTRPALDAVGELDESYGMAFEDVDYCLRGWEAGLRVVYQPAATLVHHESKTRGTTQGTRERDSQRRFWGRWGDWFDRRDVREPDGGLRIVYVTQDTGIGGGHRVIYTHLNGLRERGHHPELWCLSPDGPDWFDLDVPIRRFPDYPTLMRALEPLDAIKVATWWETAPWVWEASVRHGIPLYLVQDLETSYYADPVDHGRVLATYRPEFRMLAGCQWVADRLREQRAPDVTTFTPGLDVTRFHPRDVPRDEGTILAVGRTNPLKNFPLTRDAYLALPDPRPELRLFGIEPDTAEGLGDNVVYHRRPSDDQVIDLYCRAGVFLQTSRHEGFCLPALEAMATGAAVVCTDMNGNRDFCVDGVNCLMPASEPRAVAEALRAVLGDAELRARLRAEGQRTAESFAWPRRLDALEALMQRTAHERAAGFALPA